MNDSNTHSEAVPAHTTTPAPRVPRWEAPVMLIVIIGLITLQGLAYMWTNKDVAPPPAPPKHTLQVSVRQVSLGELAIKNDGSPEANGRSSAVYINGQPPFTYKATATFPAMGSTVHVPLRTFVQRDGTRFDPIAKAVTEVWIGGGGLGPLRLRVQE